MRLVTALAVLALGGLRLQHVFTRRARRSPPIADAAPAPPPAALTGARKQLQGNWEIVRYKSDRPIDRAAMPLMGELFEVLRLRFEGGTAFAKAGKAPEERASFEVADESGEEFRLVVKGGMFDGAKCRFLPDGQWEVTDNGPTWPGVSVLKKLP